MIPLRLKIKIEMLKKGVTGGDIGRLAGVTRGAICRTLDGEIRSRKLRQAICVALDLPYSIWEEEDKKVA